MNNSDLKNSQVSNMNTSQNLNNSQNIIMDFVNLKVAMRPVKFFKLISTEKSRIHDYTYFIEKIQANGKHNINQQIILFIKSNSQEEIKICNEDEWKNYFDNSNRSILELIDSKNTLKIEYSVIKNEQGKKSQSESQSEKLNLFIDNAKIGHSVLQSVFIQIIQNDTIKSTLKEELKNSSLLRNSQDLESVNKNFDEMLARLLETSLESIRNLSKLKSDLERELSDCSEDVNNNININMPSFCEFYRNDQLEVFRSKMLSETFTNNK